MTKDIFKQRFKIWKKY